jgi:hypothetical protein
LNLTGPQREPRSKLPWPWHRSHTSLVNWLDPEMLESLEVVLHGLERFGRVALPIRDLAGDPQWIPGPV